MGQGKNGKETESTAEASKSASSETKTTKALKPKPKIVKKSQNHDPANASQAKTTPKSKKKKQQAKGTPQAHDNNDKDKRTDTPENNKEKGIIINQQIKEESQNDPKLEENSQHDAKKKGKKRSRDLRNKGRSSESDQKSIEKSQSDQRNKEKSQSDQKSREKSQSDQRNKEKSQSDQNNKEKSQSDQKNKEKSQSDQKNKEKSQSDKKIKEKLGGLIFICNRKTKPDCFHYMVMGLPMGKQELVFSIKPGLKLFLYDFDLRLLYGIYSASSAGGMKLEQAAFNGSFPAQVRFKVHKDCIPLPESVFKKAIKENYDQKRNRFKTELTVQQVKKLVELFRPAPQFQSNSNPHSFIQNPSSAPIILPPPRPVVPILDLPESRREAPIHAQNGLSSRDQYPNSEAGRYYLPPPDYEREQYARHDSSMHRGTIPTQREAIAADMGGIPRDSLPMSEKEYRAFGLAKNQAAPAPAPASSLDPYRSGRDPYNPYVYGTASSDPYNLPPRREMHPNDMAERGTDWSRIRGNGVEYNMHMAGHQMGTQPAMSHLGRPYGVSKRDDMAYEGQSLDRTMGNETERMYSAHAATALSDYNSRLQQLGGRPDIGSLPVSSRYSFAGPAPSYR